MFRRTAGISLASFVIAILSCSLCDYSTTFFSNYYCTWNYKSFWIHIINFGIMYFSIKHTFKPPLNELSLRALFLGYSCSLGILIYKITSQKWKGFGIYAAILSTFHLTEFLAITLTNPMSSSSDTFVINHSVAYTLAAGASWIEYFIEGHYLPKIKEKSILLIIGVTLCAIGEVLRKVAIFTADRNFNHIIQSKKIDGHVLVTHGIYSICRHPSYVGWFYWSIGTQVILQNPLCLMLYTLVSWMFFYNRISVEEASLLKFFGSSYVQYQKK